MKQRMSRAHELTNVLAIEKVRWQEQMTQLEDHVRSLIGNALLSASAINYFGPFNNEFRHDLMRDFQKFFLIMKYIFHRIINYHRFYLHKVK